MVIFVLRQREWLAGWQEPAEVVLRLRVCAPSFVDNDPRFLAPEKETGESIQDVHDWDEVVKNGDLMVQECAHAQGTVLIRELEREFHVLAQGHIRAQTMPDAAAAFDG